MTFDTKINYSIFSEVEYLAKKYTGPIPHERGDVIEIDGVFYRLMIPSNCWENLSRNDGSMSVSKKGKNELYRVKVLEERESISQGAIGKIGISVAKLLGEKKA